MSVAFNACVKNGGNVITKRLNATSYMHICYPKGGGAPIAGEEKTYKKVLKGKNG
jgi:hypothetical protein